nr:hypothetical protein [uncultured Dysosmobacter sp.]
MKKRITRCVSLSLVLACIVATLCIGASATEIVPRYSGIFAISADLNVSSSGRADCYGYVMIKDGYSADLTVALQRDGVTIKSWSGSGSDEVEIEKPYYVTPGHDYQVIVTAVVRNSGGVIVERPSADSSIVSY